ncbi:MAG TPA: hypothetical protein VM409_08310 [Chloroflexia bacterium]|nr:hypothetical protein [Chloroflexia bacterium]
MAQQMMWNSWQENFRGQASDGTIVTVEKEAMDLAHRKAGTGVYESDWWPETLTRVLEHWGIYHEKWVDDDTHNSRLHFTTSVPNKSNATARPPSGPLSARLTSGPLSTRNLNPSKEE